MAYCKKCDLTCEDNQRYCPLCGHCVNEKISEKENKDGIYPSYDAYKNSRMHVTNVLARLIIIGILASIAINFLIGNQTFWSIYVIVGGLSAIIGILIPIRHRLSLASQTKFHVASMIAIIIVCEVFTKTFGWGVGYVIPFFLLFELVLISIMSMAKGYLEFDYLRPLCFLIFCSVVFYILNRFIFNVVVWPSATALVGCLLMALILLVFRFKRTLKGLKKYYRF